MSFYSDASLVLIPSGYKDQKIYSAKPTDGSGDLAFTRASDATRVASNGLIEKVRTNLNLYSEQMENAYYSKNTGVTVTANNAANPIDGALTADTVNYDGTGVSSSYRIWSTPVVTSTNGLYYTWSVYLRSATPITVLLNINLSATKVVNVTSTWQRFSITGVGNGVSSVQTLIYSYAGNAPFSIEVFGQQVETGDVMTDYIATTSAAVSVGPVSGLPRLDYLNSSCPRLILEPSRTNLVPFSESYDNAAWSSNGTVVANQGVSPSGYTDADLFYSTTGTGRRIFDAVTITSGSTYTSSVFAKASGKSFIFFPDVDNITNSVWFNLSNGTFSTPIEGTATMVDYGNGWYRCSLTTTSTSTTGYSYVGISDASGSVSFTQNGTDGVLLWGSQLELGAYPTSYINTNGTSVTRLADAASKTGISSLIGQTEGTLFCDVQWVVKPETGSPIVALLSLNNANNIQNCIVLGIERLSGGTNRFYSFVQVSNSTTAALIGSNLTSGRYKAAMAYKANDFVLYVNGVQIATDTSGALPTTSEIIVGGRFVSDSFQVSDPINQALIFKTRLTNESLAELTSL